jgi:hypothetical protein
MTRVGGRLLRDQVTVAPPAVDATTAEGTGTPFKLNAIVPTFTVVSRLAIERVVAGEELLLLPGGVTAEPGIGDAYEIIGRNVPGSAVGTRVK